MSLRSQASASTPTADTSHAPGATNEKRLTHLSITFANRTNSEDDELNSYISLANPKAEIAALVDGDVIVIPRVRTMTTFLLSSQNNFIYVLLHQSMSRTAAV